MEFRSQSFSRKCNFHCMNIIQGFKQTPFDWFINKFLKENYHARDVYVIDPGRGWELCEFEGRVCIGVFSVYHIEDETRGPSEFQIAFVSRTVELVIDEANTWFSQNRQIHEDSVSKRLVHAEYHGYVQPVNLPPNLLRIQN